MTHEELQALLKRAEDANNAGDYDEAERLAQLVLKTTLSTLSGHSSGENTNGIELRASANRLLGVISRRRSNYPKALEHYNSSLILSEKIADKAGIAKALGSIGIVHGTLSDYPKALEYFGKALSIDEELGNKAGVAVWLGNIGNVHRNLSDYPKALEYYGKALSIAEYLGNKAGVAIHLGNIGLVYENLSNYLKALEYYGKALSIDEELVNKAGVAVWLGNIGNVHGTLSDYPKALEYYGKALSIAEYLGNKAGVATSLSNIGTVHADLSDYPKALEYFGKALSIDEELGDKAGVAIRLGNIGTAYSTVEFEGFDAVKAEEFLLKALAICTEIGAKLRLVEYHKQLANLYKHEERWKEFAYHLEKNITIEKEINIEEVKKQEAIREQQQEIELAKATADAKYQSTVELLHNVLPPTIANQILGGTKLIAEKLPSVSVLFADIVDFTKLSQRISAEELVEGLDTIFSSFDALAEKHGLEKIKTIGDAYMVVSGAPEPRADHAVAMAQFALEMVETINEFSSKATGEKIQLRIGIHSGEVVAGVIGKKKFQYDLWGDAVNTAARMESHGEAGRIHVSEDFRIAVETRLGTSPNEDMVGIVETHGGASLRELDIQFIPRGEIEIKGKGIMRTFFMERVE
jgi:adenylate cyclase